MYYIRVDVSPSRRHSVEWQILKFAKEHVDIDGVAERTF